MLKTNLLSTLSHIALLGAVVLVVGCSGADDRPPVADLGEGGAAAGGAGGSGGAGGAVSTDPITCSDGVVRECKVKLPSHEGVTNCFVGLQMCKHGDWGKCLDPEDIDVKQ